MIRAGAGQQDRSPTLRGWRKRQRQAANDCVRIAFSDRVQPPLGVAHGVSTSAPLLSLLLPSLFPSAPLSTPICGRRWYSSSQLLRSSRHTHSSSRSTSNSPSSPRAPKHRSLLLLNRRTRPFRTASLSLGPEREAHPRRSGSPRQRRDSAST